MIIECKIDKLKDIMGEIDRNFNIHAVKKYDRNRLVTREYHCYSLGRSDYIKMKHSLQQANNAVLGIL